MDSYILEEKLETKRVQRRKKKKKPTMKMSGKGMKRFAGKKTPPLTK
ncbi:MAG: hypothetical protein ABIH21_03220 [Patescibacteria group bacterium]